MFANLSNLLCFSTTLLKNEFSAKIDTLRNCHVCADYFFNLVEVEISFSELMRFIFDDLVHCCNKVIYITG